MYDDNNSVGFHTREVLESLRDAWDAIDEHDFERMRVAVVNGENPDATPEVKEAKIAVHISVMRVFRRLREQIKNHLSPDYWLDAPIYRDDRQAITGLKSLEDYQVQVYSQEFIPEQNHAVSDGSNSKEVWDATLLPAEAYRRAINLLVGCATHLGYIEAPSAPEPIHDVTAYPDGYEEPDDYEPAPPEEFDPHQLDESHYATEAVREAVEDGDAEVAHGD